MGLEVCFYKLVQRARSTMFKTAKNEVLSMSEYLFFLFSVIGYREKHCIRYYIKTGCCKNLYFQN